MKKIVILTILSLTALTQIRPMDIQTEMADTETQDNKPISNNPRQRQVESERKQIKYLQDQLNKTEDPEKRIALQKKIDAINERQMRE